MKRIISVGLAGIAMFLFAGCAQASSNADAEPVSIIASGAKTEFVLGERFFVKGLTVTVQMSDGEAYAAKSGEYRYDSSKFDSSKAGTYPITVTLVGYNLSDTYEVNVADTGVEETKIFSVANISAWLDGAPSDFVPLFEGKPIKDAEIEYRYDEEMIQLNPENRTVIALKTGTATLEASYKEENTTFTVECYPAIDLSDGKYNTADYDAYAACLSETWKEEGSEHTTVFIGDSFFDARFFWTNFYETYAGKDSFAACVLNVAVSENPEGPYLEYSEYALRKEAAEKGETVTDQQVKEAVSKPTYDQQALSDALPDDERTNCFIAIDPSPFVDPVTGKKYLYMARDREGAFQHSWIYVVEMEDWATPKYETITRLTSADDAGYERSGNTINEGPQMTYNPNNGKYYLTFSVNDYGNDTYCVGQAVGDSPMGPFRKLKTEEGGLFIYSADNEGVSGAGHHFMLTVNGQLYAVYHRHVDPAEGGANRAATIDSVSWVKNSDGLEVLHLNGCSTTLQISPVSAYKNIATEAKLSVSEGENASALNDGVIPTHTTIEPWIKEYEMSGDSATITLTFDDYRTVAGIMIYNSTDYDKTFEKISSIRFECLAENPFVTRSGLDFPIPSLFILILYWIPMGIILK